MRKEYIPKTFPEKCLLLGGGMGMNQFIVVNVLDVKEVKDHPFPELNNQKVLQATVEERDYNGVATFNPYLVMYHLYPLAETYKDIPLDKYLLDFKGGATGHYTKTYLSNKKAEAVK
jgi:hypothetical protein